MHPSVPSLVIRGLQIIVSKGQTYLKLAELIEHTHCRLSKLRVSVNVVPSASSSVKNV